VEVVVWQYARTDVACGARYSLSLSENSRGQFDGEAGQFGQFIKKGHHERNRYKIRHQERSGQEQGGRYAGQEAATEDGNGQTGKDHHEYAQTGLEESIPCNKSHRQSGQSYGQKQCKIRRQTSGKKQRQGNRRKKRNASRETCGSRQKQPERPQGSNRVEAGVITQLRSNTEFQGDIRHFHEQSQCKSRINR
jgi:hypothetical protein